MDGMSEYSISIAPCDHPQMVPLLWHGNDPNSYLQFLTILILVTRGNNRDLSHSLSFTQFRNPRTPDTLPHLRTNLSGKILWCRVSTCFPFCWFGESFLHSHQRHLCLKLVSKCTGQQQIAETRKTQTQLPFKLDLYFKIMFFSFSEIQKGPPKYFSAFYLKNVNKCSCQMGREGV